MAGWGDDPVLKELIEAVGEGWKPVKLREDPGPVDVVTVEKDGESKEFKSDHLHFHRYVEGLQEDFGLEYS